MNIELRFLQKAIEDKNYISFMYEKQNYKKEKPLKLNIVEEKNILTTEKSSFDFAKISKFQVLKVRF